MREPVERAKEEKSIKVARLSKRQERRVCVYVIEEKIYAFHSVQRMRSESVIESDDTANK